MACALEIARENDGTDEIDKQEKMELLLSSETNWDQFLTPAPLAISLLGELMIISNNKEFSLKDSTPEGGFKFLRHPNSFRACLVQVSNEGWSAFKEAHTNMDQIRLYSAGVEGHVNTAVKLLFEGGSEEIKLILPKCLGRVSFIADSCKDLASSIEGKFTQVMHVTAELLEVCRAEQGLHEKRYKETVKAIADAETDKERILQSRQQLESKCNSLERDVMEANEAFKAAITDIPSSAEMFGMSFAEQVLASATEIGKSCVYHFLPGVGAAKIAAAMFTHISTERQGENVGMARKEANSENESFIKVLKIQELVNELTDIASSGKYDGKPYPNKEKLGQNSVNDIRKELEGKQSILKQARTSKEKPISKICEKGIKICKDLESTSFLEKDSKGKKGKDIAEKALKLKEKARILDPEISFEKTESNKGDNSKSRTRAPEYRQKYESALQPIIDNAKFRAEMTKEVLRERREAQEKASEDLQKKNEELQKVIREMADLDPKRVDFEAIHATLCKGIEALTAIRQQWTKLVDFFQMISTTIKCVLDISLKTFVEYADSRAQLMKTQEISAFFKQMIKEQANDAKMVALSLHYIAKTYVEVSRMHLMDKITGLSKLIAVDPNSPNASMITSSLREELHSGNEQAQKDISSLVTQHQNRLRKNAEKMLGKAD